MKTGIPAPSQRRFTLVELMVVVSIIGILATIGVPRVFAHLRVTETAEVSQTGDKIAAGIKAYGNSLFKTSTKIVADINATSLTPDNSGTTELTTIIPFLALPPDSNFDYEISSIVATAGPASGKAVACITVTGRASAGVSDGKLLYSTTPTKAVGWDGHMNRTPFVSGETTLESATAGGYCAATGVAQATCTSC